ncbi:MAG: alpha/beta hydrolase [Thermotogae bacterium]|nr:alpha/beta hydrolase [Thermotogota bacterium]
MKPEVVFVPGLLGDRWIFREVERNIGDISSYTMDYPTYPFSLGDFADTVAKVVKPGGYVVGTSMGGYVAILSASRHPDVIRGVVLLNTFASPRRILGWKRSLIRLLKPVPKGRWLKDIVRAGMRDEHFGHDERAKAYVLGVLERMTPEALFSRLLALAEAPEAEEFPEGVRAMVLYTEDDPTIPQREREYLLKFVKAEKLVLCKSGGHFPYLVNPQGFASLLREFVGRR